VKVKKVKRMCSVKGCSRTETFAITRTIEFGGVIMCEGCLRDAINAIENGGVFESEKKVKVDVPLFYHPDVNVGAGLVSACDGFVGEEGGDKPRPYRKTCGTGGVTCPKCGRGFKNEAGLRTHLRACNAEITMQNAECRNDNAESDLQNE